MERRPESRVSADIPVRIWGMDAQGKPFFENVLAGSLSSEGAQLGHVHHCVKIGDVIGIQYADKKARFEVIWAKASVAPGRNEAGVRVLPGQSVPWGEIATGEKTQQSKEVHRGDRRKFGRLKLRFPLEISFPNTPRARMHCQATDVSGHGCYVETLVPLPMNSEVQISFWLESEKIATKAVVRASDPGVGMGIEFLGLDPVTEQRLQDHLDKSLLSGFVRAAGTDH